VSQDSRPWQDDAPAYTKIEAHALDLAAELRDRVQRERTVVRRLQDYLEAHHQRPTSRKP
jgi:hypothetical protein